MNEVVKKGYQKAFDAFKERFLKGKKSIFNLDDDSIILTTDSISYLVKNFIENGYRGNANFIEKVTHQLVTRPKSADSTADGKVRKNAIEILATAAWLWRLAPSNAKVGGTENTVREILELGDTLETITFNEVYFQDKIGFAKPGTLYNTSKPDQLAYIIKFLSAFLDEEKDYIEILNLENLKEGKVFIKVTSTYGRKVKNGKPSGDLEYTEIENKKNDSDSTKVSIRNALLHFFEPDKYEPILSMSHKGRIIDAFAHECDDIAGDNDEDGKLVQIRKVLKIIKTGEFYKLEWREKWDPQVLPAKNVIYYGAPGTGKTYQVTELVRNKTDGNDQYQIQQFHPSFSYEDFIDGVKPDCIGDDGMRFKLVNGAFKNICIKAFEELVRCKENKTEPKQFYFIADEINRAELSRSLSDFPLDLAPSLL